MESGRRSFLRALAAAAPTALAGCTEVEQLADGDPSVPAPAVGGSGEAASAQTSLEGQRVEEFLAASSLSDLVQPPAAPAVAMTYDEGLKRWDASAESWVEPPVVLKSYAETDLPTPGVPGRMAWNSDRSVITADDGDDWEVPVVGNDVDTGTKTVSNTTDEELIWDGDLDAGSMKKERVYRIKHHGKFTNDSTSDTATINFYLGGTKIGSVSSTGKNADDAPWTVILEFTVVSEGSSGSVRAHVDATFNDESADGHLGGTHDVDTTIVETIEAKATWNNAKAGNSITRGQGYMEEIG